MRKWPDPADTALDRARAICYSYRAALLEVAPARCLALDSAARELGEHWIAPLPDTAPSEYVSTKRASELLGVDEATIRSWGSRSWIPVKRYSQGWKIAELLEFKASQRRRRGHR